MSAKMCFVSIGNHQRSGSAGIDQLVYYLRNKTNLDMQFDIQYLNYLSPDLESTTLTDGYDIYGFYMDRINFHHVDHLAGQVKAFGKPVVVGGVFPSFMYKDVFAHTRNVDYVVCGEGEKPLEDLLRVLFVSGSMDAIESSRYIATRSNCSTPKGWCKNTSLELDMVDDYYQGKHDIHGFEYMLMIKSNECSHHCTFCMSHKANHGFQFRSSQNIVECIKAKCAQLPISHVYFTDNDMFDGNYPLQGYDKVVEIIDAIESSNLKRLSYNSSTRVDAACFQPIYASILERMRDVGFSHIFLGVEAGNNEDLKLYGKGVDVAQSLAAIQMLQQNDIFPVMGFIMINPYSNLERLGQNHRFLQKSLCVSLANYARSQLMVEKYSPFHELAIKDGILEADYSFIASDRYRFLCQEVKLINDFLVEVFQLDKQLGGSFDPVFDLNIYHHIMKRQYPELQKYTQEVLSLSDRFIKAADMFFGPLYTNGNVEDARGCLPTFRKALLVMQADSLQIQRSIFMDITRLRLSV